MNFIIKVKFVSIICKVIVKINSVDFNEMCKYISEINCSLEKSEEI